MQEPRGPAEVARHEPTEHTCRRERQHQPSSEPVFGSKAVCLRPVAQCGMNPAHDRPHGFEGSQESASRSGCVHTDRGNRFMVAQTKGHARLPSTTRRWRVGLSGTGPSETLSSCTGCLLTAPTWTSKIWVSGSRRAIYHLPELCKPSPRNSSGIAWFGTIFPQLAAVVLPTSNARTVFCRGSRSESM